MNTARILNNTLQQNVTVKPPVQKIQFIPLYNRSQLSAFEQLLFKEEYTPYKQVLSEGKTEFVQIYPSKISYSSLSHIQTVYRKEGEQDIYFGLHEANRPPCLIWPRPEIFYEDQLGTKVNCTDKILYSDTHWSKVEEQYSPEEILNAIVTETPLRMQSFATYYLPHIKGTKWANKKEKYDAKIKRYVINNERKYPMPPKPSLLHKTIPCKANGFEEGKYHASSALLIEREKRSKINEAQEIVKKQSVAKGLKKIALEIRREKQGIYTKPEYIDRLIERRKKKIKAHFDMRLEQGEQKFALWEAEAKRRAKKILNKYRLYKKMDALICMHFYAYNPLIQKRSKVVKVFKTIEDLQDILQKLDLKRLAIRYYDNPNSKTVEVIKTILIKKYPRSFITHGKYFKKYKNLPLREKLSMF